ncbi:unnamed protein product, partial [Meganyctiphanes norvegica]
MPDEVIDDLHEQRSQEEEDKHCRCRHHKEQKERDLEGEGSLLKNAYYTRVSNQYSTSQVQERTKRVPRGKPSFAQIRNACLEQGGLYEDPEFPPNAFSINFNGVTKRNYEWKRPHEICQDPHLFVEGASRFDIQQGELGDCWVLAAVSNLTQNQKLFHIVVPRDQSISHHYAGVFHFRFWQYGRWVEVIVDDLLPTFMNQLMFMHSKTTNEFWCALLEKAYAKLYGGYEALRGGNVSESMIDLTGGVVEMFNLREAPPNLFKIMHKSYRRRALMGCAIEPANPNAPAEAVQPNGLIQRHAYSVTRVSEVDISVVRPSAKSKVKLVRIHNPWGNEAEWTGAWSDESEQWKMLSKEEKQRLELTYDDDGEFWMTYEDFTTNFTSLEICNLVPETMEDDEDVNEQQPQQDTSQDWKILQFEGAWIDGFTAGGCRNFLNTFATNPQFPVYLCDPDDEDDDDSCSLVISIMQKHVRQQKRFGKDYIPIGFTIYKQPQEVPPGQALDVEFFKYNQSYAKVPFFLNTSQDQNTARFRFQSGVYVIIPSTFDPHMEGEFLLRCFVEYKKN